MDNQLFYDESSLLRKTIKAATLTLVASQIATSARERGTYYRDEEAAQMALQLWTAVCKAANL